MWRIEYDNDTGARDEGFFEWWIVTDGTRSFRCNEEDDAKWLLNALDKQAELANPNASGCDEN